MNNNICLKHKDGSLATEAHLLDEENVYGY